MEWTVISIYITMYMDQQAFHQDGARMVPIKQPLITIYTV